MKYFACIKVRNFLKAPGRKSLCILKARKDRGNRNKNVKKYTVKI